MANKVMTSGHTPDPSKLPAIKDGQAIYDESSTTQFVDIKTKRYLFGSVLTGFCNASGAFTKFTEANKANAVSNNDIKVGQKIICSDTNKIYTKMAAGSIKFLADEDADSKPIRTSAGAATTTVDPIYRIIGNSITEASILVHLCNSANVDNVVLIEFAAGSKTPKYSFLDAASALGSANIAATHDGNIITISVGKFKGIAKVVSFSVDSAYNAKGYYVG